MRPIHPGEILQEDVIDALGMSASALARALGVPANRVTAILKEQRGISADTALRLARYLGTSAQFWLNLQTSYDLRAAERQVGNAIAKQVKPRAA
jgi:addiction module HigA family antidote